MTSYLRYKQELRTVQDADDIESWITVRGNHIPIKKGQSKEEAVKSFLESKGSNSSAKGSSQKNELSIAYHKDKGHIKEGNPPKGWSKVEGATTAPNGYSWYSNNKSMFGGERKSYLYKDKQESKYSPEFEIVRKNANANPNLYGGKYTQKSKAEAYKEYKKDTVVLKDPKTGKEIVANLSDVKSDDNVMPSANEYGKYLDTITSKTGISREDARKKYGQYTIAQWNELLSHNENKSVKNTFLSNPNTLKEFANHFGISENVAKNASEKFGDAFYHVMTKDPQAGAGLAINYEKYTKEDVEKHLKGLTKKSATDSWKRLWGKK